MVKVLRYGVDDGDSFSTRGWLSCQVGLSQLFQIKCNHNQLRLIELDATVKRSFTIIKEVTTDRSGLEATLVNFKNKFILLIGGTKSSRVIRYSLALDTWTELPGLEQPRIFASGCALGDSVYVFGGKNNIGKELNTIEKLINPSASNFQIQRRGDRLTADEEEAGIDIYAWQLIQPPTGFPESNYLGGKFRAVIAPLNQTEIVILGGHSNSSCEEGKRGIFVFNTITGEFKKEGEGPGNFIASGNQFAKLFDGRVVAFVKYQEVNTLVEYGVDYTKPKLRAICTFSDTQ